MPIAVMKPRNDGASRSENEKYMTAATPSATAYCVRRVADRLNGDEPHV